MSNWEYLSLSWEFEKRRVEALNTGSVLKFFGGVVVVVDV